MGKISNFRPISHYVLEMVQDRSMVAVEH